MSRWVNDETIDLDRGKIPSLTNKLWLEQIKKSQERKAKAKAKERDKKHKKKRKKKEKKEKKFESIFWLDYKG